MKTLFFDFGNVLAFFDHRCTVQRLLPFTDLSADELFRRVYEGDREEAYECGEITTAEFIAGSLVAGRLSCSSDVFLAAFRDIFTPNPAVLDLIPRLVPRYRLVLASNTNDAHFTQYTEQFADGLRHFAYLGTSHRAGARKPDAAFFEYCQRHAEAELDECLFIDDLAVNILAAERYGWQGVLYRPGDDLAAKLHAAGIQIAGRIP